jgi:hypothetical protein
VDIHGGEKYKLMAQAYSKYLDALPRYIRDRPMLLGYDIACLWERWTHFQPELKKLLSASKLAGPAFHMSTHMWSCYVKFHVRRIKGAGLGDLETSERHWSNLQNRIPKSLVFMGGSERWDVLGFTSLSINMISNVRLPIDIMRRRARAEAIIAGPNPQLTDTLPDLTDRMGALVQRKLLGAKLNAIPMSSNGIRTHLEKKIRHLDYGMARLHPTPDEEKEADRWYHVAAAENKLKTYQRAVEEVDYCVAESEQLLHVLSKRIKLMKEKAEGANSDGRARAVAHDIKYFESLLAFAAVTLTPT